MSDHVPGFVAAMTDPDWRLKEVEYRYQEHIQIREQIRKSFGGFFWTASLRDNEQAFVWALIDQGF